MRSLSPIRNCVLYYKDRERLHKSAVFCSLPFQHVACKKSLLYLLCVVLKINYFELNCLEHAHFSGARPSRVYQLPKQLYFKESKRHSKVIGMKIRHIYSPQVWAPTYLTIIRQISVVGSVGSVCLSVCISEIRFPKKSFARFGSNTTNVLNRNQRCAACFKSVRMYSTFTIT